MSLIRSIAVTLSAALVACGGSPKPFAKQPPHSAMIVPIEPSPTPGPLLLVAETSNDDTIGFLYGLCGWLATTEGVSRRFDPIFILTKKQNPLPDAKETLRVIEKLTSITPSEANAVKAAISLAQSGMNRMVTLQVDGYRCLNRKHVAASPAILPRLRLLELLEIQESAPPPTATLLAVSRADLDGAGVRYLTIATGRDPRHGFYRIPSGQLDHAFARFAGKALFEPRDALRLEIVDRTNSSDRCSAETGVLCVHRSSTLKLVARAVGSAFFPQAEVHVSPISQWRVVARDGRIGEEVTTIAQHGDEVWLEFLHPGDYVIHVPLTGGDGVIRREAEIRVRAVEEPWLFVPEGMLAFSMGCRFNGTELLRYLLRKGARLEYLDPDHEPRACDGPPSDMFANWMREQVGRFAILTSDKAVHFIESLWSRLGALPPPSGFGVDEWRGLVSRTLHSARARELATIAAEKRTAPAAVDLSTRPDADADPNRHGFLISRIRKWCTTLANDAYRLRAASSAAPHPGTTWIEACTKTATTIADETKSKLVSADGVGGLLVERSGEDTLLLGHRDDRVVVIGMKNESSRAERLVPPPYHSYERTSMVRLRLSDSSVTTAVPLSVELDSIDTSARFQLTAGMRFKKAVAWNDASVELTYIVPLFSEIVYLGAGHELRTDRWSPFGRIGLPIWCHWVATWPTARTLCRSGKILPYADFGADVTYEGGAAFRWALGLSLIAGERRGLGVDISYRDGLSLGLTVSL